MLQGRKMVQGCKLTPYQMDSQDTVARVEQPETGRLPDLRYAVVAAGLAQREVCCLQGTGAQRHTKGPHVLRIGEQTSAGPAKYLAVWSERFIEAQPMGAVWKQDEVVPCQAKRFLFEVERLQLPQGVVKVDVQIGQQTNISYASFVYMGRANKVLTLLTDTIGERKGGTIRQTAAVGHHSQATGVQGLHQLREGLTQQVFIFWFLQEDDDL
jgi:hypothetical protein